MGMGLALEIISWGSMLSLSEKALLTGSWWIILIPGAFLVTLLMCLTNIGNYLRKSANRKESNL
jgi:peptide/nickel transport system permease protein